MREAKVMKTFHRSNKDKMLQGSSTSKKIDKLEDMGGTFENKTI